MCLCGIMTAEYDDLPPQARSEVDRFARVKFGFDSGCHRGRRALRAVRIEAQPSRPIVYLVDVERRKVDAGGRVFMMTACRAGLDAASVGRHLPIEPH
jgi:hypothetical protein